MLSEESFQEKWVGKVWFESQAGDLGRKAGSGWQNGSRPSRVSNLFYRSAGKSQGTGAPRGRQPPCSGMHSHEEKEQ